MPIQYRETNYKYELRRTYKVKTPIVRNETCANEYLTLAKDGELTIQAKYQWDGPSGPTYDTPSFMRGSLVHDAFYQMMREGLLHLSHRGAVDKLLRVHCREDGMGWLRALWVYRGVKRFGESSAKPRKVVTLTAP
jgi:hypothetical protein